MFGSLGTDMGKITGGAEKVVDFCPSVVTFTFPHL